MRQYNSALAFASIVTKLDAQPGSGPLTYRVSGQVYHYIGSAQASDNSTPKYGQLYFMDSVDALQVRSIQSIKFNLDPDLLSLLDIILRQWNPYAAAY